MTEDLYKKTLDFYNDEYEFTKSIEDLINELKELKYNYIKYIGLTRQVNEPKIEGIPEPEIRNHYKLFFDNVYRANAYAGSAMYGLIGKMKSAQNKVLDMRIHYLKYSLDKIE